MTDDYARHLRETPPARIRTICEVHREMYDALEAMGLDKHALVGLLEEAYGLGKKMATKLAQYNLKQTDAWYDAEKNRVLADTLKRRAARKKDT